MAIPEVKIYYKIRYKIIGHDQDFESVPYLEEEVISQKKDIAGYEGVYDVLTIPVHPERQEGPCYNCKRSNDLGVKKCWNCEIANPILGSK